VHLNPIRRAILAVYGLALALVFVWVPWRGYEGLKERVNPTNLGYAPVWSPPEAPASFVQYSDQLAKYVPFGGATLPAQPVGYISPFAYKTATVDYGRVGLEFGVLTALLLIAWIAPASNASLPRRN
jgi:hypothetical protein